MITTHKVQQTKPGLAHVDAGESRRIKHGGGTPEQMNTISTTTWRNLWFNDDLVGENGIGSGTIEQEQARSRRALATICR